MARADVHVPTLVQQVSIEDQPHYHFQPLFIPFPVVVQRRFEKGVSLFQKEINRVFRIYEFNRRRSDLLLWYVFQPELQLHHVRLSFHLSKQLIQGKFTVVHFSVEGHDFLLFPAFNQYISMLPDSAETLYRRIEAGAEKTISNLLKQRQKESGNTLAPSEFMSKRREFIITTKQHVRVGELPFKFKRQNQHFFFSRFFGETNFDGRTELERVGSLLNDRFPQELNRAYLREATVEGIKQLLFHGNNSSFVLVGDSGVGRHSVLEEALFRHLSDEDIRKKSRVWHMEPTRVIAGMSVVGMWEKRFEAILQYLKRTKGKVVVDNPLALLRIGKSAQNDLTLHKVLRTYLERREIQLVLVATPDQWKILQEKDRGFSDLFQLIRIQPATTEEAIRMVLEQRKKLELDTETLITPGALKSLFYIHRNFLHHQPLPGGVMKLLRQLVNKHKGDSIEPGDVRTEFKLLSGFRASIFQDNLTLQQDQIYKEINQELVGQKAAVQSLTDVIQLVKARLNNPDKPLASLLFIGPTGVGKTQAAKVLCQYLTGSTERLIRFDMNEYIAGDALHRLVGDFENPEGMLISKVRYQPFGVLLLDEIEKAHPSVHDLLLQVLDDGRLTDARGQTVDFSNIIIIMTSNLGAREVSSQISFRQTGHQDDAIYLKSIRNFFRPEFVNRIERTVIFQPLELDHILGIARLQIQELLQRDGFVRRTTLLNISKAALEWVAKRGFDGRMGGRALKRQIERDLTALSAQQLIATEPENPILLDILLEEDQLRPVITSLNYIDPLDEAWLPSLPNEDNGRKFYGRLLRIVESFQQELIAPEEEASSEEETAFVFIGDQEASSNWQLYHFRERLSQLHERVQNLVLGFRDAEFREGPAIPFRLKSTAIIPRRGGSPNLNKAHKEKNKDILFQKDALQEINLRYQHAIDSFNVLRAEFLSHYLEFVFLKALAEGISSESETSGFILRFSSCVEGQGGKQVEYMINLYSQLLDSFELPYKRDKKKQELRVEWPGGEALFAGEAGIHLFFILQRTPMPIRLEVFGIDSDFQATSNTILRLYDENRTLTDLRTGLTNLYQINSSELKMLLYGGLPAQFHTYHSLF
jgi:ATP-dependent Clp protease ATP-binding subunit ClpC